MSSRVDFSVEYETKPPRDSKATKAVKNYYGFQQHKERIVIADGQSLELNPGEIVLFCGPSGCGKSSLLRTCAKQLDASWLAPGAEGSFKKNRAVVDHFDGDYKERVTLLSRCGLSDVPLLLSSPDVLSDGQKYRFALAQYINSQSEEGGAIAADEWCANLDRSCAKALCYNVRKLVDRRKLILLVATTHDDIIHDLQPDYIVRPFAGSPPRLIRRADSKDLVASWKKSNCRQEVLKAGTTSLGGIIEIISAAQL